MMLRNLNRSLLFPGRIVVAFVAEFRLWGFWHVEGTFAELLGILEKACVTNLVTHVSVERSAIFPLAS